MIEKSQPQLSSLEKIDRNPTQIEISEKENQFMYGIWNKNSNQQGYEYVDPSVFYFEATLFSQQAVQSNGKRELIQKEQIHPMVPCTNELFATSNLA